MRGYTLTLKIDFPMCLMYVCGKKLLYKKKKKKTLTNSTLNCPMPRLKNVAVLQATEALKMSLRIPWVGDMTQN